MHLRWSRFAILTPPDGRCRTRTASHAVRQLDSVPLYSLDKRPRRLQMTRFTIGRAAKAANISVETIRFYERRGLIAQPRKPAGGGAREYDEDAVARIRFVRQAQDIGFSLREIGERSEEHTSELQSLMRISYAVFCLKKKK